MGSLCPDLRGESGEGETGNGQRVKGKGQRGAKKLSRRRMSGRVRTIRMNAVLLGTTRGQSVLKPYPWKQPTPLSDGHRQEIWQVMITWS